LVGDEELFFSAPRRAEFNKLQQVSISPTFYKHLLGTQIPKAQKIIDDFTVFWDLHN
jgi:hypothetical protein